MTKEIILFIIASSILFSCDEVIPCTDNQNYLGWTQGEEECICENGKILIDDYCATQKNGYNYYLSNPYRKQLYFSFNELTFSYGRTVINWSDLSQGPTGVISTQPWAVIGQDSSDFNGTEHWINYIGANPYVSDSDTFNVILDYHIYYSGPEYLGDFQIIRKWYEDQNGNRYIEMPGFPDSTNNSEVLYNYSAVIAQ